MPHPTYSPRGHIDSSQPGQAIVLIECNECGALLHRDARPTHNRWHMKIFELLEYPARQVDIPMEEKRTL